MIDQTVKVKIKHYRYYPKLNNYGFAIYNCKYNNCECLWYIKYQVIDVSKRTQIGSR